MATLVGTSGWQYRDWRGEFYPKGVPTRLWLEYYSSRFPTVEINNAFYRLPDRSTFTSWRDRTPPHFVISVKASRYLTHIRRLQAPAEPVARLVGRIEALEDKLGPVLLQLPPTLALDLAALRATLRCFPREVRVAVEFRHPSWFVTDTEQMLAEHGAALCLADGPKWHQPLWRTVEWGYVRLHEGRASPHPCYGEAALRTWASRIKELYGAGAEVFAYFNNDTGGCAPRNAFTFARLLERTSLLEPSRAPIARTNTGATEQSQHTSNSSQRAPFAGVRRGPSAAR
jgi:uncharacterized protein YecE (DUF72 family)